jgi:hypothetical protein
MKQRHISSLDRLSEVHRQCERWRKDRRRGTRIPEDLWRAAADVSREVGVSKTAQELRLDYYKLRRLTETQLEARPRPQAPPEGGFLELSLGAPALPECVLEIEDPRGARLRVELKGATPAHLEILTRTLRSFAS